MHVSIDLGSLVADIARGNIVDKIPVLMYGDSHSICS